MLGVEFAWSREDLDVEGPIQSYSIIPSYSLKWKINENHGNGTFTGSSFDSSFEALLQPWQHTFHLPDGLLKSLEGYTDHLGTYFGHTALNVTRDPKYGARYGNSWVVDPSPGQAVKNARVHNSVW